VGCLILKFPADRPFHFLVDGSFWISGREHVRLRFGLPWDFPLLGHFPERAKSLGHGDFLWGSEWDWIRDDVSALRRHCWNLF